MEKPYLSQWARKRQPTCLTQKEAREIQLGYLNTVIDTSETELQTPALVYCLLLLYVLLKFN
jgi:hypothetical protein